MPQDFCPFMQDVLYHLHYSSAAWFRQELSKLSHLIPQGREGVSSFFLSFFALQQHYLGKLLQKLSTSLGRLFFFAFPLLMTLQCLRITAPSSSLSQILG